MRYLKKEPKKKKIKTKPKRDPITEYKRGILISVIFLVLGIAQIVFVVSSRSQKIWLYKAGPATGNRVINVPPSFMLPNRYIFTIAGLFPHILDENVVGNVTLEHQGSGKTYFFNYTIVGYLMYEKIILDAKCFSMKPGWYNVSWDNNVDRFEYYFTTHGLFNFFPSDDRYPSLMETIMLIISIFGLIALSIASIKKYLKTKRNYAYHRV
jgi:hypothetical protein